MSPLLTRLERIPARLTSRTVVLLAALLVLLVTASGALAAPGTLRMLQVSPSLGHRVAVTAPGGGTFSVNPGRSQIRVTPGGGDALLTYAWCVLPRVGITSGIDYAVDLQTPADTPELATPALQEAAWLMSRADDLLASAANPGREAAAVQVAVWQLTGQAADIPAVTADTALNARVAALRAMAAGRTAGTAPTLAVAAPAVAGAPVAVTVTGTPGAVVTLSATGGALSATQVTLDADGTARVSLTPAAAGEARVVATTPGWVLWRAVHPSTRPAQDLSWVVPSTLTAELVVPVAAAPPVTPEVPVTPVVPVTPPAPAPPSVVPTGRPAALHLVKTAPRAVMTGLPVRYTLTITNVTGRTAEDVVVRDVLPRGTYLRATPAGATLVKGVVVWRIGDLAPKATVVRRITLWTLPTTGPVLRNAATAVASNAALVRARAVTRVLPLPPGAQPSVTG